MDHIPYKSLNAWACFQQAYDCRVRDVTDSVISLQVQTSQVWETSQTLYYFPLCSFDRRAIESQVLHIEAQMLQYR